MKRNVNNTLFSRREWLTAAGVYGLSLTTGGYCARRDIASDKAAAIDVAPTSSGPTFSFKKTGQVILPRGPAGSFDSTHSKYPCLIVLSNSRSLVAQSN